MSDWWWLSFCDPDKPAGSQFLRVVIVAGGSIEDASQRAWELGINPGGQILGYPLSSNSFALVPEESRNKLLSKTEALTLNAEIKKRMLS